MKNKSFNNQKNGFMLRLGVALLVLLLNVGVSTLRAQCSLITNPMSQVSLGPDCMVTMDPTNFATGLASSCNVGGQFQLEIFNAANNAVVYTGLTTASGAAANTNAFVPALDATALGVIGQTRQFRLTRLVVPNPNPPGGTSNVQAWGTMKFEDKLAPILSNCPLDITVDCTANITPTALGLPTILDCSTTTTTFADVVTEYSCSASATLLRKYVRTITVKDAYDNISTCLQNICIRRANVTTVTAPLDLDDVALPALACGATNTTGNTTGFPKLNGQDLRHNNTCNITIDSADVITPMCGNSKKITRTWTVYENCSPGSPKIMVQTILLLDKTPPTIGALPDMTIGASNIGCSAMVILPPAIVSDNCSNSVAVKVTGVSTQILGTNGGVLPTAVAQGVYTVKYQATDACGLTSTMTFKLSVVDNVPPTPICKPGVTVSLTSTGDARLYYHVFDNGSYDNCAMSSYQVKRMDKSLPFNYYVDFDCADVGKTIQVILEVTDAAGNKNTCMSSATIQDKLPPMIVAPADVTIDCKADYSNLNTFGTATATDNCAQGLTVSETNVKTINNCGVGTIVRKFTATDGVGLTAQATQKITLKNMNVFNATGTAITWPADLTLNNCNAQATLLPANLPAANSQPTYINTGCDIVASTYSDDVLSIVPNVCYRILRHWSVINWCLYDPNISATAGRWDYTQIINVVDNTPPSFLNPPQNLLVSIVGADCSAGFTIQTPVVADNCQNNKLTVTATTTIPAVYGTGFGPYTNVPKGVYTANYKAIDGCGNVTNATSQIVVRDAKKPTPIAMHGLSTTLMPSTKDVTVNIKLFEKGSYDNCTPYSKLKFSFSPITTDTLKTFTCANVGANAGQPVATLIELWVTDEAGNQDFTTTYIVVEANMVGCPTALQGNIAGAIQTEMGDNVDSVAVHLLNNAVPMTNMAYTANTGGFMIPNLTFANNYEVKPNKSVDFKNGISTFDLVLLSRHILGIQQLNSPYKLIAADLNNSGKITTSDAVEMRKLILGLTTTVPGNTSWRFVDKSFQFPNPANPFETTFPEKTMINNLTANAQANFVAIKVGDLNGTAKANSQAAPKGNTRNSAATLTFEVSNEVTTEGKEIFVPVRAKDWTNVASYQMTLNFDQQNLDFVALEPSEYVEESDFSYQNLEDGLISAIWVNAKNRSINDNTVLFTLRFKAKTTMPLSQLLEINSKELRAENYDNEGNVGAIKLNFAPSITNVNNTPLTFELYQNQPNPFKTTTKIGFQLPEATKGTLKIYDLAGRTIKQVEGDFNAGLNEISFDDLQVTGVLFYQLEVPGYTATKKMIVIE